MNSVRPLGAVNKNKSKIMSKLSSSKGKGSVLVGLLLVAGSLLAVLLPAHRAAKRREYERKNYYSPDDVDLNPDAELGNRSRQYYRQENDFTIAD